MNAATHPPVLTRAAPIIDADDPPPLTFDEFRDGVRETLITTDSQHRDALHMVAGLAEEAGEVMGKFKRLLRGDEGARLDDPAWLAAVRGEIGDTLWYAAALADVLGMEFEAVGRATLAKLRDRKARGKLRGTGDNR